MLKTPSNTHFSTHSLWLVKIHVGPYRFGVSHMYFNQLKRMYENCVLEGMLLAFLLCERSKLYRKKKKILIYILLFGNDKLNNQFNHY